MKYTKSYETVTEALNALNEKGYKNDFSILSEEECIYCHITQKTLNPDDFVIDEVHHFDGETDPADEMIVYAISSDKFEMKGTLVNAFGMYADYKQSKLIEKLHYREDKKKKPIKRAKELIMLSREHHHALLLCWKIKSGLTKNISNERIYKYIDWFYQNHLLPHFNLEEKYVFPLLHDSNEQKQKALKQHQQLRKLFESNERNETTLQAIQELLNEHIRFEERLLFNEVQKSENIELLKTIAELHYEEKFCDNDTDPFWL